ncbi:MAG TPA: hypothetical protein PL155_05735 [Candidatus Omnitrophota bacterium]|nr:hypothetical protein [Candidatus Omnitrophota bacterium]HPD84020.1 hypothetical protein [Candidatus Omnitrophota bacterium]HRZ02877.1 hypothetical protein [Candidatus Omnitrophota bacterium]
MNNQGKAITIFLIVISILLLSVTGITLFFLKTENDLRKSLEVQLAQAKASAAKLDGDLKESKKKVFLMEEKMKDADVKINGLMDELELQEGLREQGKVENAALKEALDSEKKTKEAIERDLTAAQEKIGALEQKIKEEEARRAELEAKIQATEMPAAEAQSEVELGKIVVTPGEIPEGKILSVNAENNFAVFDLGQEQGVAPEMIFSVYRGEQYLGDIKVARVETKMSVADIVEPLTSKQLQKNDRVTAKK